MIEELNVLNLLCSSTEEKFYSNSELNVSSLLENKSSLLILGGSVRYMSSKPRLYKIKTIIVGSHLVVAISSSEANTSEF